MKRRERCPSSGIIAYPVRCSLWVHHLLRIIVSKSKIRSKECEWSVFKDWNGKDERKTAEWQSEDRMMSRINESIIAHLPWSDWELIRSFLTRYQRVRKILYWFYGDQAFRKISDQVMRRRFKWTSGDAGWVPCPLSFQPKSSKSFAKEGQKRKVMNHSNYFI